ncbi:mannosyltransferase putative-domain-containing protein [Hyaloraphidium curvatum]|nr:mannosyltransferase putative-domain-containing protein [Hyaloraphidium curvatum]
MRRPRAWLLALGASVAALLAFRFSSPSFWAGRRAPSPDDADYRAFWLSLAAALRDHSPPVPNPPRIRKFVELDLEDQAAGAELINMTDTDVEKMAAAHAGFLSAVEGLEPPRTPGTRGIATTAAEKHFAGLLVALRLLRKTGSRLPVEVFLERGQPDDSFCEELAGFGAECRSTDGMLGFLPQDLRPVLSKYQHKAFAILLSSFEEVLFLDADNLALNAPDFLFDTPEFVSTGLLLWPDIWISSVSGFLYRIQGTQPPADRGGTHESGQLAVSKPRHAKTLILAAYYNLHGPTHYYRLLSMGGHGEGDKETFPAAARALGLPHYVAAHQAKLIGYMQGEYLTPVAMLQHAPGRIARPLFLHANGAKPDPAGVLASRHAALRANGRMGRIWGDSFPAVYGNATGWGADPEKAMWEAMAEVACGNGPWSGRVRNLTVCEGVGEHIRAVYA